MAVRISMLGPLRVEGPAGEVHVPAARERSVLLALALSPGSVVSTDTLIRVLWGDRPPATARKTLQNYVARLRRVLGSDAIATRDPGYVLRADPDHVDVVRFRALVRAGEAAMRQGVASRAREQLAAAVSLWRGAPFEGVPFDGRLAGEAVRLEEEYLSALETRIAADLAEGCHDGLVGELEELVSQHPYRERLWGHLMVALYRCGRQADALAAFQRVRSLLVTDLGLEPGGELRRLETAVLGHDPGLAAATLPPGQQSEAVVRSPVRYARSSRGVSVAYQVAGDGPLDILAVPGFVSHLDIWWNAPTDRLVRRLTSMGRLISFDKRGMGLSDRPEAVAPDDWVDDAVAVLDAVGSSSAVVLGVSSGGATALRLVARCPERVQALILQGGYARALADADYPEGWDREVIEGFAANLERGWGTGVAITRYAPSRAEQPGVRDYWARYQLLSASPEAAIRFFWAAIEADVRDALPDIRVPTLVLHAEHDVIVPVAQGRYVADRIPGAELVTLDSDVHLICVSDVIEQLADEIEAFIARVVPAAEQEPVLVTVLAVRVQTPEGRRHVETAIERNGGAIQRPAVTATFHNPGAALRAATALSEDLTVLGEDGGIGLHVGDARPTPAGFRGVAIEVAHQLAEAARPGEVLVTHPVRDLVDGRHRFELRSQLARPEGPGCWQVFAAGFEQQAGALDA